MLPRPSARKPPYANSWSRNVRAPGAEARFTAREAELQGNLQNRDAEL